MSKMEFSARFVAGIGGNVCLIVEKGSQLVFGYGLFHVAHDLFELHVDHAGRIKCAFTDAMDL